VLSGPATITGTNLLVQGAGTITVRATQSGSVSYEAAIKDFSIVVNKSTQSITIPTITFNGASSSGLNVSYQVTSGNASISGNTLRILGPGKVVVVASQPGNENYSKASNVTNVLTVP
jgi:hypothetical protein